MTDLDLSGVYWMIGLLAVLAGVVSIPYHRDKRKRVRHIKTFQYFMEQYLTTLHTYSKTTVPRLRDTTTLSRSQKRLQEGLVLYDDQLYALYALVFGPTTDVVLYLRTANIIFDRNGSVELWMNLSETTEEILYYPEEHLKYLNVALDNLNQAIDAQIQLIDKD